MSWENARTPQEKQQIRLEAARIRLNGIIASMSDNMRYVVFTGRSNGPKTLWRTFKKAEFIQHFENDSVLLPFAGMHGTLDMILVPATGVIEGYL